MNTRFRAITAFIMALTLFSCHKTDDTFSTSKLNNLSKTGSLETNSFTSREGELVLGKKLNNPYTVANMQAAAKALSRVGLTRLKPEDIRATHYYVKFMPADSTQFEALDADRSLTLYPYPLDFEIVQSGNHYRDPATPRGGYAYQYAAVKADYAFSPRIPYEIIAKLYIPEEDARLKDQENYLDRLLDQAYIQTGNFQDTIKADKGKTQKKSYYPGGKIQIFDTRLNQLIGLEGVDMRARRWFTTYHARPDFGGNYRMGDTFKRPCNYSLWFSQHDFTVKPHLVDLTAWINGPKILGDWNYDILSGYDRFIGHIFRGAYRYSYGFIDGLERPYNLQSPRIWYIGVDADMGSSGNNYLLVPVLRISRYQDENIEYDSDEIFSTTCHETAHTSHARHMALVALSYFTVSFWLQESWATGVEWWITKLEYKNTRGIPNYGDWSYLVPVQDPNYRGYQEWTHSYDWKYTNIYINLIDNYNEKMLFGTVDDNVKGYTLAYIESNMLRHIFTLKTLKKQLKAHKPNGVTDADIDKLLIYY
ncbi:MAG: hypothetical protein ACKOW2_01930 [Sphingobacteriaceae bacterium]